MTKEWRCPKCGGDIGRVVLHRRAPWLVKGVCTHCGARCYITKHSIGVESRHAEHPRVYTKEE
jgi:hypothetical protein